MIREFFPNGYGISIVIGTHSNEVAVLVGNETSYELCYDTPITDDTLKDLTLHEVYRIKDMVRNLPERRTPMPPRILERADLFFTGGGSDKEYHLQLTFDGSIWSSPGDLEGNCSVAYQHGKRGSSPMKCDYKIEGVPYNQAKRAYDAVLREKLGKGYIEMSPRMIEQSIQAGYPIPPVTTVPISSTNGGFLDDESRSTMDRASGPGARSGPVASHRRTGSLEQSRPPKRQSGAPETSRSAPGPQVSAAGTRRIIFLEDCQTIPGPTPPRGPTFVPHLLLDITGDDRRLEELLIDPSYGAMEKKDGKHLTIEKKGSKTTVRNKLGQPIPFGTDLFNDLPDIHIDCEEIQGKFHCFDLMSLNSNLTTKAFQTRYEALKAIVPSLGGSFTTVPLITGTTAKKALFNRLKKKEGIVFVKLDATYTNGAKTESKIKYKFYHEVSARVKQGRPGKRSVGLELLDENSVWRFMGNCTIGGTKPIPAPGSIIEIKYLYCYKGGHLYQPSFLKPRDDVAENECTMSQLHYKTEEGE